MRVQKMMRKRKKRDDVKKFLPGERTTNLLRCDLLTVLTLNRLTRNLLTLNLLVLINFDKPLLSWVLVQVNQLVHVESV